MRFERSERYMGQLCELYTEKFDLLVRLATNLFDSLADSDWRAEMYSVASSILTSEVYVVDGRKMMRNVATMSAVLPKLSAVVGPKVKLVMKANVWDTARKI